MFVCVVAVVLLLVATYHSEYGNMPPKHLRDHWMFISYELVSSIFIVAFVFINPEFISELLDFKIGIGIVFAGHALNSFVVLWEQTKNMSKQNIQKVDAES